MGSHIKVKSPLQIVRGVSVSCLRESPRIRYGLDKSAEPSTSQKRLPIGQHAWATLITYRPSGPLAIRVNTIKSLYVTMLHVIQNIHVITSWFITRVSWMKACLMLIDEEDLLLLLLHHHPLLLRNWLLISFLNSSRSGATRLSKRVTIAFITLSKSSLGPIGFETVELLTQF